MLGLLILAALFVLSTVWGVRHANAQTPQWPKMLLVIAGILAVPAACFTAMFFVPIELGNSMMTGLAMFSPIYVGSAILIGLSVVIELVLRRLEWFGTQKKAEKVEQ